MLNCFYHFQEIPDPDAEKPSDWDEEMDGIWEAALVANPACASAPGFVTYLNDSVKDNITKSANIISL